MRVLIGSSAPGGGAARLRAWLCGQHGATAAEAAVAEALMGGLSPEQISETRGVSINTIRSQIRRLLEKTEASGILSLIAMLSSLP